MRKSSRLALLYLLLFLYSCSGEPTGNTQAFLSGKSTTETPSQFTPVVTAFDLSPSPPPTRLPAPTPIPTISPTNTLAVSRYKVPLCKGKGEVSSAPQGYGIEGTIIYQSLDYYEGLYTLGGNPLRQSQIPVDQTEYYNVFGFSPDGKWLAYSPIPREAFASFSEHEFQWESFDIFLLSDSRDQAQHTMDIIEFAGELPQGAVSEGALDGYWVNNQLIHVNLGARTPNKTLFTGYYIYRPKVFNPFSGEWKPELINLLPDRRIAQISFSPDQNRILYFVPPERLVLWDNETGEIIWFDNKFSSAVSVTMDWAPNGSMAVIIDNTSPSVEEELSVFLINRDGKIFRSFANAKIPNNVYWSPISQSPLTGFFPSEVVWSPNSQFIAMSNGDEQIFIYDVEKDAYLFMCPIYDPDNLTWSPDSRYIAMGDQKISLKILDIESEEVVELLPYGIPVGWSATFPVEWP